MRRWMYGVLRDDEPEPGGGDTAPDDDSEPLTDNLDPVEELLKTQRAEIERVTRENKRLRRKIHKEQQTLPVDPPPPPPHNEPVKANRKSVFDAFFGRD